MKKKSDKKTLLEFLEVLYELTGKNILFLKGREVKACEGCAKYREELHQVQKIINSLEFE